MLLAENFCVGQQDGEYAYSGDCAWYYSCDGSVTSFLQCPDGLLYGVNQRDCILPDSMDLTYRCTYCSEYDSSNSWGC